MDSLLRRFVISFLARMSEEGVLGNYLVNRYMSSEVRKILEIVGARTKEGVSQRLGIAQVYHVGTGRRWRISGINAQMINKSTLQKIPRTRTS